MSDVGYDGVFDVPDEVHGSHAVCIKCGFEFIDMQDDPDCGETGCPVDLNAQAIYDMARL